MNPIPTSSTAITENLRAAAPRAPLPEFQARKKVPLFKQMLAPIASLRLTVVLFLLALFLVFVGTLAQMNASNFTVIKQYFRSWTIVWIPWQLFVQFGQVFFGVPESTHVDGSFPFPAGGILGALLLLNLLAAHAVRFRLSWSRCGMLILHAGLIVLILGELITWHFAIEGNMTIEANSSSNYLEHREFSELVIASNVGNEDEVVVIPDNLLRPGHVIENELLPFDVEVVRYMPNSTLASAAGKANPATAGVGRLTLAIDRPEGAGVDTEAKMNLPSAYLTLYKKGTRESLGTYMVSLWLNLAEEQPQQVTVDGKTYTIAQRFKRTYKPYTIHLLKFVHDVYPGTDTPKDFRSQIRLVDPSRKENRVTDIWMNNPLFYAGETFYQQGFLPGDTGTILQVVRNPGWPLPYISCVMVAVGMLLHFGQKLLMFLTAVGRQRGLETVEPAARGSAVRSPGISTFAAAQVLMGRSRQKTGAAAGPVSPANWLVPLVMVSLAAMYLVTQMLPPRYSAKTFQLGEAAPIPVLDRGRIKPLETRALTEMMIISGKQYYIDKDGRSQPAIRWALDVLTSRLLKQGGPAAEAAATAEVFRIDNLQVLQLLGLEKRHGFRYALSEFEDKMDVLEEAATRAQGRDKTERDLYDNKVIQLAQHLTSYINLARMTDNLRLVPPPPGGDKDDWQTIKGAVQQQQANGVENPALKPLLKLLFAYAEGDAAKFNEHLSEYRTLVQQDLPVVSNMAGLEVFYNNFAPFSQCWRLDIVVFVLACLSWLVWREPLRRSAFWLLVLVLVIQTCALGTRMFLQGRPPVTNLYSSAVFIGWGCLVLGVFLEMIFRLGVGSAIGAVLGLATVMISDHLATSGDTLEMMQAVLDTNFWLATHVVAITTGYTASFMAGALGTSYLIVYVVTRQIKPLLGGASQSLQVAADGVTVDVLRVLGQMTYGVMCFAVLFSFVGTVLGGIWADESWGRFWGWDPKENGALMIVIWSALVLHARWAGIVKMFGVAVLTVLGNCITAFSWFGTNQLGVGLHAYGFSKELADGLFWFWVTEAAFLIGVFTVLGIGNFLNKPHRPAAAA